MSYRIDLTPNASYTETVSVSQDDVGREIAVDLYLDGTAYTPTTGTTITMQGTKPSGLGYTITGTASGSTVTFLTTLEMTQEAGRFASEIVLTNGTTVIGTANFALYVEKNPHPENTTDGTSETMQTLTVRMDELEDRVEEIEQGGGGLTDGIKQALLQIAQKVAYIDEDGQNYYDALEEALYPPADLVSISAVYSGGNVYNNATLDSLKTNLVVTAHYDDSSTEPVTTYVLSGNIATGTQTITVTYGGKTTSFTVTVVDWVTSITATYTQSGTVYDTASLDDLKSDLVVTANYADSTSGVTTDYTLSGTLEAGTSTITVTCYGKTDTFNVTVTSTAITTTWEAGQLSSSGQISPTTSGVYTSDYIPMTNGQTITLSNKDATWTNLYTNGTTWAACVFYRLNSSQAYTYIYPRLTNDQEGSTFSFTCDRADTVAVRICCSNMADETIRDNMIVRVV